MDISGFSRDVDVPTSPNRRLKDAVPGEKKVVAPIGIVRVFFAAVVV